MNRTVCVCVFVCVEGTFYYIVYTFIYQEYNGDGMFMNACVNLCDELVVCLNVELLDWHWQARINRVLNK